MSQLWIIAGPNGAGKTTIADRWFATHIPVVSADSLAAQHLLSPVQAGRMAVCEQGRLFKAGLSFVIDTTLSGKRELMLLKRAAGMSYKTNLVFVCVKDIVVCKTRIAERIMRGGHNVPAEDVARRYRRSLAHLADALALADRSFILDNSGKKRRLLLSIERGRIKYLSNRLPDWANEWIPIHLLKQSRGLRL